MGTEGSSGQDPLVGTLLGGKYLVEAMLARGGMGRVYRGVQQPLGRTVAIKVLDFHALDPERNQQLEKRFFLEASVCAKLTHPNTLTVHDYGTIDGARGIYIVMEFLEGKSLRDRIREVRALTIERTLHIGRQICAALIEAHEAGLVHRDLKPANVVLVPRGSDPDFVKVVDFGLVKQVASKDDSNEALTQEGLFLGTPRYMAPEQITGGEIDARTDIYALGILLYECLTGQPPFKSKVQGQVPVDLFTAHVSKRPPPFSTQPNAQGVPAAVEAIVMRCLEKQPEARYASMREVFSALDAAARGLEDLPTQMEPMRRLPLTVAEALEDDAASSEQATAVTMDLRKEPKAAKLGVWIGAGLGLVVVALGIALWVVLGRKGGADDTIVVERLPVQLEPAAPTAQPPSADVVVKLRSEPSGATVTRGGARLGVTPLTVTLPRGSLEAEEGREVRFELEGYVVERLDLEAPAGDTLDVEVMLARLPPPKAVHKPKPKPKRPKRSGRNETPDPVLDIKVDR